MIKVKSNKLALTVVAVCLTVSFLFVAGSSRANASEGAHLYLDLENMADCTSALQSAMNEAAAANQTLELVNPEGNRVWKLTGTLRIPDKLVIEGNNVTLLIDGATGFKPKNNYNTFTEFAVLTDGFVTGETTTFNMSNLNFEMQDNEKKREIPKTLFAMSRVDGATITNCSFAVYSSTQLKHNAFDAYNRWNNITIRDCEFIVETDAAAGGVWIRNIFGGEDVAGNSLIEDCYFYGRGADEMLGVYASTDGRLENVTVRGCTFEMANSAYNNPSHLISLGHAGDNRNFTLQNCNIHMEAVYGSVIKVASTGTSDEIYILDNTIVVDEIITSSNYIISGDTRDFKCVVSGNDITVNSKSGLYKTAVSGKSIELLNNHFYGNGYAFIAGNVTNVQGNIIENCQKAFYGVVNCIGNTVKECSGSFMNIQGYLTNGTEKNIKTVTVRGNTFISSTKATVTTVSTSAYCRIDISENIFKNVRFAMGNETTTNTMDNNVMYLETISDIVTQKKTKSMNGNIFFTSDSAPENLAEYTLKQAAGSGERLITDKKSLSSYNLLRSAPLNTGFVFAKYADETEAYAKLGLGSVVGGWVRYDAEAGERYWEDMTKWTYIKNKDSTTMGVN